MKRHSTLIDTVHWWAAKQPTKVAFTYLLDGEAAECHLTFEELERNALAVAALLQQFGASGERVVLVYPPGLEFISAFFGCLFASAIATPTDAPHPARPQKFMPRLQRIAADCQPKFVLTCSSMLPVMADLLVGSPETMATQLFATDTICEQSQDWAGRWQGTDAGADTMALLQYTSGSTSQPKGVLGTHANLLHNSELIRASFDNSAANRTVSWLPHYHDMGLIGVIIQCLYSGCRDTTLMSPVHFLQRPVRWLQAISRYRANASGGPNFAYELCTQKVSREQTEQLDLSSWRIAFNGSEPVRSDTLHRFANKFARCRFSTQAFVPCYGLAEATLFVCGAGVSAVPICHTVDPAALAQNRVVAVDAEQSGRVLVGSGHVARAEDVVVVDPATETRCPAERVGEIWVRGSSVGPGYWNANQQTQQTFGAYLHPTGEGPFLRTGDLGFIHDNELYVTGRLKDLILVAGRNHYPQDIEQTVEACHDALREGGSAAFVVEVDTEERLIVSAELDPRLGRKFALQQNGTNDLIHTIREAVAEQHEIHVHDVVLLKAGTLPRTSSGKRQRHQCRADYVATPGNGARQASWSDCTPLGQALRE